MSHYKLIEQNIETAPFVTEITTQDKQWYYDVSRQKTYSAHKNTHSIPLRLHPEPAAGEYPGDLLTSEDTSLVHSFPLLYEFASATAKRLGGELGRILITRLAPHKNIGLHYDGGQYYKVFDRFHLVISNGGDCGLRTEGEVQVMEPGELWSFNNLKWHSAFNNGNQNRIHLVFDIKFNNSYFPKDEY